MKNKLIITSMTIIVLLSVVALALFNSQLMVDTKAIAGLFNALTGFGWFLLLFLLVVANLFTAPMIALLFINIVCVFYKKCDKCQSTWEYLLCLIVTASLTYLSSYCIFSFIKNYGNIINIPHGGFYCMSFIFFGAGLIWTVGIISKHWSL